MIARIFIPLLLLIVLPYLYFDLHYWRRRYRQCHLKRLLRWLPAIAMLAFTVYMALIPSFIPDDFRLIDWYFCLSALLVYPVAGYALCSFLGLMHCRFHHTHRNLGNLAGLLSMPLIALVFGYGWFVGVRQLSVKHINLDIEGLPEQFEGYRIVQFSDAHVGSFNGFRAQLLHRAIDSINVQRPDLIVFTGDMQNIQPSEVYPFEDALRQLKARDGIFSILGNHDYSDYLHADPAVKAANEREIVARQQQMGWKVLRNEWQAIHWGNDSIVIAGQENMHPKSEKNRSNLPKTIAGIGSKAFIIMLQHNPKAWNDSILTHSRARLTLSGHTHGGQMALFGLRPTMLTNRYDYGLYEQTGRYLYVSGGLGGVVPFRLGMNPEIVVITLHAKHLR